MQKITPFLWEAGPPFAMFEGWVYKRQIEISRTATEFK
jgi:hypothetical protein